MCHFDELRKNLVPVLGLLDTEEKVRGARQSLEEATEEDFKKLDEPKRRRMLDAKKMLLG